MDRDKRRIVIVSIVVIIVIVSIAVGARYLYLRSKVKNDEAQILPQVISVAVADKGAGLYFSDPANDALVLEQQVMPRPESPVEFARVILERLIKGSQNGLGRTVPSETVLKAVYLSKDGTAYLDFSKEIGEKQPGGVREEYMTVMAITNSLASNIQEIKRVKFLIEGKDVQTLAGHVDLSEPFVPGNLMMK